MTTDVKALTVPSDKNELVREQYAKGLTDNEFQVFLELANRYGLDPFARQIWAVKGYGSNPAQIMVARDGYLAIAHRSGQFDGMSDPEYTYDDKGKLTSVRIHVYRKDMSHPFTGEAWDDEDNLHQSVWNKRPRTMLLKVAESRALRKAFSVSGTYSPEEMGYEEQPIKIEPKPSDIKVKPEPAQAPKPEPAKPKEKPTCKTCTEEEVNLLYLPKYQELKLKLGVFTDANLGGGLYNLDMITADYKEQTKPAPAPAPAPKQTESKQTKPSASLTGQVCERCGKPLLESDIKMSNDFCDCNLFCEKHCLEYVANKSKLAKN